jgi:Na+/proline symporter
MLGITTRRVNARGALAGFLVGACIAIIHHVFVFLHWLHYGSMMNANFHVAIYGFVTTLLVAWVASDRNDNPAETVVFDTSRPGVFRRGERKLILIAALLLLACVWLNFHWR